MNQLAASGALPYSDRLRVSLALARGIAAARGDEDLNTRHVALGVLREGENGAIAALHHAGVTLSKLRYEVERILGQPPNHPKPEEVAIPLTAGERSLLDLASQEANELRDPFLGPHHLLLAILRMADDPVAQAFARQGIRHSDLVLHLRAVGRPHEGHPHAV